MKEKLMALAYAFSHSNYFGIDSKEGAKLIIKHLEFQGYRITRIPGSTKKVLYIDTLEKWR